MNNILSTIYYDPKHVGSFGGVLKLYKAARQAGHANIKLDDVRGWLKSQDPYTLHRPVKRKFKRNRVVVEGVNCQMDADLADMSAMSKQNDGVKYLLVCIDVFSRYLQIVTLKSKTANEVIRGFEEVFNTKSIKRLRTDRGGEFTSKKVEQFFVENGVHHFVTHNEPKANYSERVIRSVKGKIVKFFTHNQTQRYVDVLPDIVRSYNDSVHSSIGMAPSDVSTKNEMDVFWYQYVPKTARKNKNKPRKKRKQPPKKQPFTLSVGDHVRLTHLKRTFMREYDETYTGEVYQISKRFYRQSLPVYHVTDLAGDALEGTFYQQELQKINIDDDQIWKVSKVLKTRKRKGHEKEHLVRWLYFPSKFDSWVKDSDMQDL